MNMGAIQTQWSCNSFDIMALGMSFCSDALPTANSSQALLSSALDVNSNRIFDFIDCSSYFRECGDDVSNAGGSWMADVGPW